MQQNCQITRCARQHTMILCWNQPNYVATWQETELYSRMRGRPCAAGFHQSWMSFSVTNSRIAFQIRFRHFRHNRNTKSDSGRWSYRPVNCICTKKYTVHRGYAVFRLVLKRVWRDIRDSHNGGHCLLTVGGRLRRVKIGGECVKYAWLSCPARPSRRVLCISMQSH